MDDVCYHVYLYRVCFVIDSDALRPVAEAPEETVESVYDVLPSYREVTGWFG